MSGDYFYQWNMKVNINPSVYLFSGITVINLGMIKKKKTTHCTII